MIPRSDPAPRPAATADTNVGMLVGKRVHKYDILRVIGRGGMGTVYEAINSTIGKRVAMKFIDARAANNADAIVRFQREAQAASTVESAHIVDIFDSGISEEGQPYIVMEMLRGEDLGHRIKRCGRLELPEALHITGQILRGLRRAHKAGIVHRDLKPDNIFLVDRDDDPNFAKILDFGISKVRRDGEAPVHTLTRQGTVLGTPFYMSPEQAQGKPDVDARSDLWSVGAILYECLTGRPPYTGTTYEQVIVNICMNDADDVRFYNPAVSPAFAAVLQRALSRNREERFPDARSFLDALHLAEEGEFSVRSGVPSEDSAPGLVAPGLAPGSSNRRAARPGNERSTPLPDRTPFDSTLRFDGTPQDNQPSSERWVTAQRRGKALALRRLRTVVVVALSALLVGGLGAFLVARRWMAPVVGKPPGGPLLGGPGEQPPASPVAANPTASSSAPHVELSGSASRTPFALPASETAEPRSKPPKSTAPAPVTNSRPSARPGTIDMPNAGVAPDLKLKTD